MKLKIYAPIDGQIFKIYDLNDGVFSSGMLGLGFFIKPKLNASQIKSPLEVSNIANIFETKHAIILENGKIAIMIHVGLDTVKLNGKYFELNKKIKVGDEIMMETNLLKVDFNSWNQTYNDSVCVTFVNSNDFENKEFKLLKTGNVKSGELIGEIYLKDENNAKVNVELVSKNRYEVIADEVFDAIGTNSNYDNFTTCMTRMRFHIIDKKKVDEEKLKKIKNIQGVIWANAELQIVIGADVEKAKNAFENKIKKMNASNEVEDKKGFWTKSKNNIAGVMTSLIPYLIASGMLYAIWSILTTSGAIQDINNDIPFNQNPLATGVFYIICTSGLAFMGFGFGFATVKYMGGNTVVGSLVCLTLLAIPLAGGKWVIYEFNETYSISIQGYANLVIPQVAAAITYVLLDRWVKTWMPSMLDFVLRHFLVVFVTLAFILFGAGPILSIVEIFFKFLLGVIEGLPYGINVMLYAFSAPIMTILGIAWAVNAPVSISVASGKPSSLATAWVINEFSVAGAGLGVALRTKNSYSKKAALIGTITGICGISEPLLYGTLLPRPKILLITCSGSALGGLVGGLVGLKQFTPGGGGVFYFTQFISGGWQQVGFATIAILVAFSFSCVMSFLFLGENIDPKRKMIQLNKKVIKESNKLAQMQNVKDINFENDLTNIPNLFDQDFKNTAKKVDSFLKKKISIQVKVQDLENNINDLFSKTNKAVGNSKKRYQEKLDKLNNAYTLLKDSLKTINKAMEDELKKYELMKKTIYEEVEKNIYQIANVLNCEKVKSFTADYWNIINNLEILYQTELLKPKTTRKIIKNFVEEGKYVSKI